MVVDWSQLPKDILNLISERLDSELDFIRLRSICSHWRSSSIPNHHTNIVPFKFPLIKCVSQTDTINNNNNTNIPFSSLSKRSLFLVKPPPQQQTLIHPWLIRVTQTSTGKTKLSQSPLLPFDLPSTFQFSLDLNKSSVLRFGTDFIIDVGKGPFPYIYLYPKKVVAVTPLILAILLCNDRLVLLHCGDERWTDILSSIGDICVFKGRIYAVEEFSFKTFTIRPEDSSVQLVADEDYAAGSDIKFLVESEGDLLLVDITYEPLCSEYEFETALTINVYILDEKEKEWVELTSLGDRILFLGSECSFSASASDLSVAKGNYVIFMDDVFEILDKPIWNSGMCVFDLDELYLSHLSDCPDYLNLFWPPPEWIVKS